MICRSLIKSGQQRLAGGRGGQISYCVVEIYDEDYLLVDANPGMPTNEIRRHLRDWLIALWHYRLIRSN